jgi:hypothetical protein
MIVKIIRIIGECGAVNCMHQEWYYRLSTIDWNTIQRLLTKSENIAVITIDIPVLKNIHACISIWLLWLVLLFVLQATAEIMPANVYDTKPPSLKSTKSRRCTTEDTLTLLIYAYDEQRLMVFSNISAHNKAAILNRWWLLNPVTRQPFF